MARRAVVAGISGAILLVLACSVAMGTTEEPAVAPTVGVDAADTAKAIDLLTAGTTFIDQTSFRLDVDFASQITTLSHTDNVKKRGITTMSMSGRVIEIRMIDSDVYLKTDLDLPGVGHEWMTLDPARVPPDFALSFAPGKNDPGGSARLINAIVTARADGSEIVGTFDVTRVGPGTGINFRPPPGGTFPDGVRSHPFRATLDADGRLVGFLIPAASGLPNASLRYSDFGASTGVTRPEGAVAAPDALYPQLGLND
ncbi:hypothetical protein JOD64_000319 [Micromonospora luteifusca]|uniref:LppX_LprAFG lipoprotein n=1 Tax=Micromonospora luteifusca TaxID=709860 RepID=A0ABS2LMA6_9ACTN|nr:hypothetical protein [Micromonospora luteifusca]MBM7489097.1 hypothetical protein [Micromonospora luteifusca]